MSIDTDSSDWIGKKTRVWSVVSATSVPSVTAAEPDAIVRPANQ
jgi:hypothetical protein